MLNSNLAKMAMVLGVGAVAASQFAPKAGQSGNGKNVVTLPSGHKLQILQMDITKETTDAIINPANGRLAHGGGAARAIAVAAGEVLQKESAAWVASKGQIPTGSVAITNGGNLPAKKVIHAVGPVWKGGAEGEEELLRDAMWNSLEATKAAKLNSIAVPAISSGIFGFPKDRCADILLRTTAEWCRRNPNDPPKDIHFTNFDAPTVDEFRAALQRLRDAGTFEK